MKLNAITKSIITAVITAIIVDMWRNWPWAKELFLKATKDDNYRQ